MRGAQAVVHRAGGRVVVAGGVAGAESGAAGDRRDRGIEVQPQRAAGRGLGRQGGGGDLQRAGAAGEHPADRGCADELAARSIDDVAVLVELELAVTAIHRGAVVVELEKAAAVDGHIERVARGLDIALRELLRHRGYRGADAHLSILRRGARDGCGVGVGELGVRAFEAHRVGVGDVVAHHLQVGGGGLQAGQGGLEGAHEIPRKMVWSEGGVVLGASGKRCGKTRLTTSRPRCSTAARCCSAPPSGVRGHCCR